MKILEPIESAPEARTTASKYMVVLDALDTLSDGMVLPIECDGVIEARKLYSFMHPRRPNLTIQVRGSMVYISRK